MSALPLVVLDSAALRKIVPRGVHTAKEVLTEIEETHSVTCLSLQRDVPAERPPAGRRPACA